eukprot:m.43080 g.43080  ORF g.43080 m.43080 type:complete len:67 (-) comp5760_c0_seq2:183-383(-)
MSEQPDRPRPPVDCLQCKIVGTASFTVLGLYMFYERSKLVPGAKNRTYLAAVGLALFGGAAVRAMV